MSEVKRYTHDWRNQEIAYDEDGEFVYFDDYENLKAQLEKAEKVLNYIAEGNDHWAEAEQIAASEYFKEKEQVK